MFAANTYLFYAEENIKKYLILSSLNYKKLVSGISNKLPLNVTKKILIFS